LSDAGKPYRRQRH